jgi:hypothetical protein
MSDAPRNPFQGGDGTPIVKFTEVGDEVAGKVKKVEYREATDLDGNVRRFADGSPKPCVVVHLDVNGEEQRDFVQGRSVSQFREKVWAVEGDNQEPKVGASYRRKFTGKGEASRAGYSPEKLYEITYTNNDRGDLV